MKYKIEQKDIVYIKCLRNIDNTFWNEKDIKCFLPKKTFKIYQRYFRKVSHIIDKKKDS